LTAWGISLLPLNAAPPYPLRGEVDETDDKPPTDWAAARVDYEAGIAMGGNTNEIAARYHISTRTLLKHAVEGGWRRRTTRHQVDRGAIIARMFRVLDRQIVQLEQNMTETGEKEVAVLGKLASTLEKLIDIDNAAAQAEKPGAQRKDIQELRNKLAQRIAQLKRV
jgi:hypothetical protein